MEPAASRPDLFDRRFVSAAIIIGGIYALVVAGITKAIGHEAAGVAAAALTALTTAIFKQFEGLRFRALASHEYKDVHLPQPDRLMLLLLAFAFHGGQKIFGLALGVVFMAFSVVPETDSIESMMTSIWGDWKIVATVIVGHGLAIVLVSFLAARAAVRLRYSTILFAILLAGIIDLLFPLAILAAQDPLAILPSLESGALWPAVFWLAFLAAGLFGAWAGRWGLPAEATPVRAPASSVA
jgi:hypothetical protein